MGSGKASYGVMGISLMLVVMMFMAGGVAGQGPAAAPAAQDCDSVVLQLVDCLPFVAGQATTPPATCCSNLSSIIDNSPQCLCQLYNTTFTEPLGINVSQALLLPPACKLSTPPPSLCSLIGVPVPGPVSSSGPALAPNSPTAPSSTNAPTPSAAPTPSTTSSTPSSATAPSGGAGPAGSTPSETPPTNTASPPNPSSAPCSIVTGAAAAAASLLFASALYLL